jgi:hypothetical protein
MVGKGREYWGNAEVFERLKKYGFREIFFL